MAAQDRQHQTGPLQVTKEHGISEEVKSFLESIAWGNEGAVYQRHDLSDRLFHLPDPYVIVLRDAEGIAGTALFNKRTGTTQGWEIPFYYVCFFAASPRIRGKGYIKSYGKTFMTKIREDQQESAVYMGVIERGNHSSFKVAQQAEYEVVSTLKTVGFSRFFPKQDPRFRKALPSEYEIIKARLKSTYDTYALVHFTHLFHRGNYFVLEEDGQIIAGLQVHPARWDIKEMPGVMGKIQLHLLPYIPLIRRLYNPRDFRFLSFEGIFFPTACTDLLHRLMESCLHHFQCHTALLFLDERAPLYHALQQYGRLGLINRFTKHTDARIVASLEQIDDHRQKALLTLPWYTTGFDYI